MSALCNFLHNIFSDERCHNPTTFLAFASPTLVKRHKIGSKNFNIVFSTAEYLTRGPVLSASSNFSTSTNRNQWVREGTHCPKRDGHIHRARLENSVASRKFQRVLFTFRYDLRQLNEWHRQARFCRKPTAVSPLELHSSWDKNFLPLRLNIRIPCYLLLSTQGQSYVILFPLLCRDCFALHTKQFESL